MKPLLLLLCGITAIYAQVGCFPDGSVWLRGLGSFIAGRVEFCRDRVWGTVCANLPSTPWSEKNAQVVCRCLGYSGALNSILQGRLPLEARILDGDGTPIHNRVTCLGNEEALDQCDLLSNSSCTHAQDVAITCRSTLDNFGDGRGGDIRLVGDARNGFGAVQLRHSLTGFMGICPDDGTFDTTEANIVCRQLGYASGSVIQYSGSLDTSDSRAEGFNCNPEDTFLNFATCNYDLISTNECSSPNIVGVACISSNVPTGTIRLAAGASSTEGRVEIFINGKWGRVCSSGWDMTDGEVACRELGFGTDNVRISETDALREIDNRIQPVWLGDLECLSTSASLNECTHLEPTGYADCYRSSSRFAFLGCGSDSGSGGISSGAIIGIVFVLIFIAFFIFPFGWAYGKKYLDNRESRCLDNCSTANWSPSRNTNTRTTGGTHTVFSLSRNASEPEPERDERETELIETAPPSYQAASNFPAADPTELPPSYPGSPKLEETGYPTAPGAYPPPTGGASYPPVGARAYPPGGPGYPPGDLAYPPVAVPGANLQGYPPPTQAGAAYPPTLELAYPPATATAPYPVEIPQQRIDPVLAEELANVPRETAPASLPRPYLVALTRTLDQPPH